MAESELTWQAIHKDPGAFRATPVLRDYEQTRREFSWAAARAELDGLPGGGLNIAHEAVDRHARGASGSRVALRWRGRHDERRDITYAELSADVARFASSLRRLGVGKGDAVFALAGRVPALYIAALATLKNGSVFSPLFAAFGPEPIKQRMTIGKGKVLITTPALYRRKVAPVRAELQSLEHVILVRDPDDRADLEPGTLDFDDLLADGDPAFPTERTMPGDPALLHFTSGTTGRPKGAIHVHEAVVAHHVTGQFALDFHDGDVFWCTADPGWVTGTSYGIISPLTNGLTLVIDEGEFEPARWYSLLRDERVKTWYTAPTAVRMLMKAGIDLARGHALPELRFIASVGEPLNPEAVLWGVEAFGQPIHDNWWQTETGGIMISNFAAMDIKPGSMGKPLPGIDAAIVEVDDARNVTLLPEGAEGELALRAGWPSMFRGYLNEDERYRKCFAGEWYLTGDLARVDQDGYFWFVGRADDVIKSAGHLIGPFEVESTLMAHPAVAEAGVIGKPDPVVGDIVKAFVSLKAGYTASDDLMLDILGFARKSLGPAVAPREIAFLDELPRTRSGKIMRRLLRARELGLPEGDLSTLETSTEASSE